MDIENDPTTTNYKFIVEFSVNSTNELRVATDIFEAWLKYGTLRDSLFDAGFDLRHVKIIDSPDER